MTEWLVLKTCVASYADDIEKVNRILNIIEHRHKVDTSRGFYSREEISLIAAMRHLPWETMSVIHIALHEKLKKLCDEQQRYICPECGAPRKVAYDGKEPAGYLYKITTCSEDESHFEERETIRSLSVKYGIIEDETDEQINVVANDVY